MSTFVACEREVATLAGLRVGGQHGCCAFQVQEDLIRLALSELAGFTKVEV